MRPTLRLGTIAGIPVGVHWSALAIMLLLGHGLATGVLPLGAPGGAPVAYWVVAVAVTVLFLGSLLAHELCHAVVARHFGVGVRRITLWLLGGVAELESEPPHARADLLVALAGPAASFGVAVVFGVLAAGVYLVGLWALAWVALAWLALVNAVLAVFNLLPGAPLDGGRVLRAAVWWWRGDRAVAQRVAAFAGMVVSLLLVLCGTLQVVYLHSVGGLWLVLLGWFLLFAAQAEQTDFQLRTAMAGLTVADAMTAPPVCGYVSQRISDFVALARQHRPADAYPVLDPDGNAAGLVTLSALARATPQQRAEQTLRDVRVPPDRLVVLAPDVPLADAARQIMAGRLPALVVVGGVLVGLVGTADLARAVDMNSLRGD
ncbi:site-2 protease family protein [Catellatospora tritici]|uniref:site-2 protease family protein n=1 Tax=Catellatospora tritici TaxID=2851566 RepID=UPI001C2DD997|nr:site-2 protease family protein [Catellatospora tritici]MBV1850756.1 site-2 protease family protein [Catellatospora tritici]MBV1851009.1 site-2 protease family protein [Catellatospora tritici]